MKNSNKHTSMKKQNLETTQNKLTELTPIYGLGEGIAIVPFIFDGIQLNMILDSGAVNNMLDERVFNILETRTTMKKIQEDNQLFGFGGNTFDTSFRTEMKIELGNHIFDTSFIVTQINELQALCEQFQIQIHGFLGHEFIVKNELILDYSQSAIYINNPITPKTDMPDGLVEMGPLYGLTKGVPVAIVKFEDIQLQMLVDTGASGNLLDERVFNQISEIKKTEKNSQGRSVMGFGGSKSNEISQTKLNITLGEQQYDTRLFLLPQIQSFEATISSTGIMLHGVLGNEFLFENGLILDYSRSMIYTRKTSLETAHNSAE